MFPTRKRRENKTIYIKKVLQFQSFLLSLQC
nr:MAG TPA: hypothetical protein [Bacteriophage sp.]